MSNLNSRVYNQDYEYVCHHTHAEPGQQTLRTLLTDWIYRNIRVPGDTQSLLALAVLIISAWLIIGWMIKLILAIIWPIVLAVLFAMVFPCIKEANFQEVFPKLFDFLRDVCFKGSILISRLITKE